MTANNVGEQRQSPMGAVRRIAGRLRRPGRPSGKDAAAPITTTAHPDRLLSMPLLSDLTPSEAAILSLFMRRAVVPAGTVVIEQGGHDTDLYLIEDGQAEVRLRDDAGRTTTLATLGSGDFFGEIAFVTGVARTADVVAVTPLTLYSLGSDGYAILSELTALEELTRTAHARAEATRAAQAHQQPSA